MPAFPDFKLVEAADQTQLQAYIDQHAPYSDFNFTSFFTWNTSDEHSWSMLDGNLVLQLSDYIDGQPVFTMLGTKNVDENLKKVIEHAETIPQATIKLIPNTVAKELNIDQFTLTEDPDNFDYIFSLEKLASLSGRTFKSKRHEAARCQKEYPDLTIETIEFSNEAGIGEIYELLHRWFTPSQDSKSTIDDPEYHAIANILTITDLHSRLRLTIARNEGIVVGFSVDEFLNQDFVLSHYFKTDTTIRGLGAYFNKHIANDLLQAGYKYWNWEQDLGIAGLKKMKRSYRPVDQLRKYIVTLN